jgi:hypothetical protein
MSFSDASQDTKADDVKAPMRLTAEAQQKASLSHQISAAMLDSKLQLPAK